MARSVASFRPNDSLTQGELQELVAALTEGEHKEAANPNAPVTMAQLDARLVRALGLGTEASAFYEAAVSAGLHPPARFGTEAVARLLGLRTNHPTGQDDLERLPSDPAPRAEVAYSLAQILRMSDWERENVQEAAEAFEIPTLTPWERRVLKTAVGFIGFPYIWGGESEWAASPFGLQPRGGFDCSVSRGACTSFIPIPARRSSRTPCAVEPPPRWPVRCRAECGSTPRDLLPRISSSSAVAKPDRLRSTTWGSTSATGGSSTPRATASPSLPSRVGTTTGFPGAVGRWSKQASKKARKKATFSGTSCSPERVMAWACGRETIAVRTSTQEEATCSSGDLACLF